MKIVHFSGTFTVDTDSAVERVLKYYGNKPQNEAQRIVDAEIKVIKDAAKQFQAQIDLSSSDLVYKLHYRDRDMDKIVISSPDGANQSFYRGYKRWSIVFRPRDLGDFVYKTLQQHFKKNADNLTEEERKKKLTEHFSQSDK